MKQFKVTFLHTDGDTRITILEAYNITRARFRFYVNWDKKMKIISINKL